MQASARNIIPSVSEADLFNERDSEVTPAQEVMKNIATLFIAAT